MRTRVRTPLAVIHEATMKGVVAGSRVLAVLIAVAVMFGARPAMSAAPLARDAAATVSATSSSESQPALHSLATFGVAVQPQSRSSWHHGATPSVTSFDRASIAATSGVRSGEVVHQAGDAPAVHGYDATAPPALS